MPLRLIAECPECSHEWPVTEQEIEQLPRGPITIVHCPKCKKGFKAGPLRSAGFIYFTEGGDDGTRNK